MAELNQYLMDNGVFLYSRWNYMFVVPPIIINEKEMAEAFAVMDKALDIADRAIVK
jgi:taurine--2-oxoglutarate transaminase